MLPNHPRTLIRSFLRQKLSGELHKELVIEVFARSFRHQKLKRLAELLEAPLGIHDGMMCIDYSYVSAHGSR
jgi:hypothetical protein